MKTLYVGDVHCTPEEIEDCRNLVRLIEDVGRAERVERLLFLGDQYHTHAIVNLQVMAFWKAAFEQLSKCFKSVVALVGNHDMGGLGPSMSSMMAHEDMVHVIDHPLVLDGILHIPYCDSTEDFIKSCQSYSDIKSLVCHQTFDGSRFENGFYTSDGIDSNLIPQEEIISGHIHAPQQFGKVWYVGAPRWRTLSDANTERAIWVVTHAEDGRIQEKKCFDTGTACRQIRHLVDTPENPIQVQLDPKHNWRIDIKGPSDWIEQRKHALAGPGIRIRTFKTEMSAPKVRESDGIGVAFSRYTKDHYRPTFGTPIDTLKEMAAERLQMEIV